MAPTTVPSSVIDKLIFREKPKLSPVTNTAILHASTTAFSPDSIQSSTSSSSTAASTNLPADSALQTLLGTRIKPLPPSDLEIINESTNQSIEIKKKDSSSPNTDLHGDTSDIKTLSVTSQSPVTPLPTVLEIRSSTTASKSLSSNYMKFY